MRKKQYRPPRRVSLGGYRGRGRLSTSGVLIIIIAVLAVLVVAGLVWFLVLQNHVVYSADGAKYQFSDSESSSADSSSGSSAVNIVISSGASDPAETGESASSSGASQTKTQTDVRALEITVDQLLAGQGAELLSAAGANTAVVDMKQDDGSLNYVSTLSLAAQCGATSADSTLNSRIEAAVTALEAQGYSTAARISCFRDGLLQKADQSLNILTHSGYRWKDSEGIYWSSPTSETVQTYVAGIAGELAQLGFDTIVLDNARYPTAADGTLSYIQEGSAYDTASLSTVIKTFYQRVADTLNGRAKLAVVTAEGALTGTDTLSGQTAAGFAPADYVLALPPETGASYDQLLTAAGVSARAILILTAGAAAAATGSWAVMN